METKIDIGPQITKYRGLQFRKFEVIFTFISLVFFFAIPFLVGFYRILYGYTQYGLVAARTWGLSWLFLSIFFLIVIGIHFLNRLAVTKLSISIHRYGMTVHRPLWKDRIIRWDQVTDLYVVQERFSSIQPSFLTHTVICTADNKRLTLRESEVQNLLHLVTQIKSSVYIHLKPRLQESYRIGNVVYFGPLEVHKKYLSLKLRFIGFAFKQVNWKDIEFVTIKSGHLLLKLHTHKQYRIRISRIPNLEILMFLINDSSMYTI
jgi:hypothetical protein